MVGPHARTTTTIGADRQELGKVAEGMSNTQTVQTEKGRSIIDAAPVLHPFLLALYPVLGLYAFNQERTLFSAVFRPGFALLLIAFVLWLALGAVFRNSYKAGIVTTVLVLAATSGWNVLEYAMAFLMRGISGWAAPLYYTAFVLAAAGAVAAAVWYSKVSTWDRVRLGVLIVVSAAGILFLGDLILAPIFQRGPAWAMLTYGLGVASLVYFIRRWEGDLRRTTSTLNLFGFILLGLSLANILINRPAPSNGATIPPIAAEQPGGALPDVWLITLDGYARNDVMAGLYGFNTQPFISELEERGFTHLPGSMANYGTPIEALTSCLNMEYFHEFNGGGRDEPISMATVANWYHDNRVTGYLQAIGYRTCASAPPNELLKPRGNVDLVLESRWLPSEFEVVLLESTVVARVLQATHYIRQRSLAELRHIVARATVESKLTRLQALAEKESDEPRFVQVHLSVPDAPFLFDRRGEWPESVGLYTYGGRALFRGGMREYQEGYAEQVYWLNRELLDLVDRIQAHAETPPVILLVSMQGPTGPPGATPDQQEVLLAQRYANFMAVHVPGATEIPEDLSPVNLFRVVLNSQMGFEYPLLPNHRYIATGTDALVFERLP